MGSHHSASSERTVVDRQHRSSLLFTDLCGTVMQNYSHPRNTLSRSHRNHALDYDPDTMETLVNLWCVKSRSLTNWNELSHALKNQLMQDLLDTLYCTSHAFDELFMLLLSNAKSRLVLGITDRAWRPRKYQAIVEDILRYSASMGLKYHSHHIGSTDPQSVADFPLKTFSLCPCTRRPLYVATYLGRPDIVQLLLKHGARIPCDDVCECMSDTRHPMINVLDVLRSDVGLQLSDVRGNRTKTSVQSLRLLLVDLNHGSRLRPVVVSVLGELDGGADDDLVPSLKHVCRASIRENMRNNYFLYHPHVWHILGLPETLAVYMNLEDTNISCQE